MSLFEPGVVYPSDEVGEYTELDGEVTEVEADCPDEGVFFARVRTREGTFEGFGRGSAPAVGYLARIRLYPSGGGWYPDDRIVGWSAPPEMPKQTAWARIMSERDWNDG